MLCRRCFWSAAITRKDARIWCAHKRWHGWMTLEPKCNGAGFQPEL